MDRVVRDRLIVSSIIGFAGIVVAAAVEFTIRNPWALIPFLGGTLLAFVIDTVTERP